MALRPVRKSKYRYQWTVTAEPNDRYVITCAMFREIFEGGVDVLVGNRPRSMDRQKRWEALRVTQRSADGRRGPGISQRNSDPGE
jgi:hypothetical protein